MNKIFITVAIIIATSSNLVAYINNSNIYSEVKLKKTSSIATKETINNFDFDIIKKGY